MKNLRISLALLSVILITLSSTSCKKGENDPGISVKSRKSRITNEWSMRDMTNTGTEIEKENIFNECFKNTTTTTDASYDVAASRMIESRRVVVKYTDHMDCFTLEDSDTTYYDTSFFDRALSVDKDGSFTMTENSFMDATLSTDTTYSVAQSGRWSFIGKSGDIKNKEQLLLRVTDVAFTSKEGSTTTTENYVIDEFVIFDITRLAAKEFQTSITTTEEIAAEDYSDVLVETMSFEPK